MAPVLQPDAELVDCGIEPISFLAAVRKIALSVAASEGIKELLASIRVKQKRTNTDERNLLDKAFSLLYGLSNFAREYNDFNFLTDLISYDFDRVYSPVTSAPKKRQGDNDERPVEAKRNRTSVNELEENSHGDTNNDNNQPSTSGVSEMEKSTLYDSVSTSFKHKKTRSKKNKHNRQYTGSRPTKSYESPSKGLVAQCVFCKVPRPGTEVHYRETHNVTDPEQILFYNGTPLVERSYSNVNTQGGEATWFLTQKREAEKKYEELQFNCRLCDTKMGDKVLLEKHYMNNSLGHQIDQSKLTIMDTLFKFRAGANLEGLPTSNPRKVRKPRFTGSGKDRSVSPDNDNVSARVSNTVEPTSAPQSQASRQVDTTQGDPVPSTSNHCYGPMISDVCTIKTERNDDPNTADDHYMTHSSVVIKEEVVILD